MSTKLIVLIGAGAALLALALWSAIGHLDIAVIAVVAVLRFFGTLLQSH